MKLVIIEPLGVNDEKLLSMAKDMLPADLEIVYYNTRVTDTETLIERGRDADIIAVSNLPMNADVINGCKNLKMLSVAFTGVDHIAMDACKANGVLVSNCAGLLHRRRGRPGIWHDHCPVPEHDPLQRRGAEGRHQGRAGRL